MLIQLTGENGDELFLDHTMFRAVTRNRQNRLLTEVATNMIAPSGPVGFLVKESASDVAATVNACLAGDETAKIRRLA